MERPWERNKKELQKWIEQQKQEEEQQNKVDRTGPLVVSDFTALGKFLHGGQFQCSFHPSFTYSKSQGRALGWPRSGHLLASWFYHSRTRRFCSPSLASVVGDRNLGLLDRQFPLHWALGNQDAGREGKWMQDSNTNQPNKTLITVP